MDRARLLRTPPSEINEVFSPAPPVRMWIDPQLSAVYVVSNAANDWVKIGFADNLKHRFAGLDCGSPVDLRLRHFVFFAGKLVAKSVEKQVHAILDGKRRKGEWFDVTVNEAAQAIAEVTTRRRLSWWTEVERRALGSAALEVDCQRRFRTNFFLRN